jgi:hypothetical protein
VVPVARDAELRGEQGLVVRVRERTASGDLAPESELALALPARAAAIPFDDRDARVRPGLLKARYERERT